MKRISECGPGFVVRTGVLRVSWTQKCRPPVVRLVDPDTRADLSEPFPLLRDLEVLEVLRDQSFYAAHGRAGDDDTDPLRK